MEPAIAAGACAMAALLVYVSAVVVGAWWRRGEYSHVRHAVSELLLSDAPNVRVLNAWFGVYNVLTSSAAALALAAAPVSPAVTVAFAAMAVCGAAGLAMAWAPMDPRTAKVATRAGVAHLVLAGIMSLLTMVSAFGLGAGVLQRWQADDVGDGAMAAARLRFGAFSLVAGGIIFASGAVAARSAAGAWPTMGVWERATIGTALVWSLGTGIQLVQAPAVIVR